MRLHIFMLISKGLKYIYSKKLEFAQRILLHFVKCKDMFLKIKLNSKFI